MKVCYIVLVYNELEYTKKTFESIQAQEQGEYRFDIICIDNASCQFIGTELREYCKKNSIIYLRHEENDGYAGGNNFGWDYAKKNNYDYVFIANNDIELLDPRITVRIIEELAADTSIAILGTHLVDAKHTKIKYSSFHRFIVKREKINRTVNLNIVSVPTVVGCFFCVRVSAVPANWLFKRSFFMYAEEQQLEYELMRKGNVVAVLRDENFVVKHYGGFFDYEQQSKWKIYLSVRNTVLMLHEFSPVNRVIYKSLFFMFVVKTSLKHRVLIPIVAFFKGLRLCSLNVSDLTIYNDALNAVKKYR